MNPQKRKLLQYEIRRITRDLIIFEIDPMEFASLRDRQCEFLNMFVDGLTFSQIAEEFDLSRERVRQIFYQALRRLRYIRRKIFRDFNGSKDGRLTPFQRAYITNHGTGFVKFEID